MTKTETFFSVLIIAVTIFLLTQIPKGLGDLEAAPSDTLALISIFIKAISFIFVFVAIAVMLAAMYLNLGEPIDEACAAYLQQTEGYWIRRDIITKNSSRVMLF